MTDIKVPGTSGRREEMVRTQLILALGTLLIIGGVLTLHNHKITLPAQRLITSQEWQADFPGDTKQVLEQSQHFTLLSLDPKGEELGGSPDPPIFHGYHVIGQTQVNLQVKSKLIATLYDGMAVNPAAFASCFSPRHGIHAVLGNKPVDLVICFHCQQFLVYPGQKDHAVFVSKSAQPTFDQALTDARVPLSPR